MIKFKPSDKWYQDAVSKETQVNFVSGGKSFFSNDDENYFKSDTQVNMASIRKSEAFSTLLRMLRLNMNLSFEELSEKVLVDVEELFLLERKLGHKANPRTLIRLSNFYKIDSKKFLQLGGVHKIEESFEKEVARFAAKSESFDKLTREEKKLLQGIIRLLK